MKHFNINREFQGWKRDDLDGDLLRSLDILRDLWGHPIIISPAKGAVGRKISKGGKGYESLHNIWKHGTIKAVDVFPICRNGCPSKKEMRFFYELTKSCLFNGIGIYSDTTLNGKDLHYMAHLDLREDELFWHRENGKYIYGQKGYDSFFNDDGGI